jgi:hypothetical protein
LNLSYAPGAGFALLSAAMRLIDETRKRLKETEGEVIGRSPN